MDSWRRTIIGASFGLLLGQQKSFASKEKIRGPVQIIFPIPFLNAITRELPAKMLEQEKIEHYIEGKFGGSGVIATRYLQTRQPNETLMVTTNTLLITNFIKQENNLGDHPRLFFKPIGMMYQSPFVLVIRPDRKEKNIDQFIDSLRSNKFPSTYSITAQTDIAHLMGLMLASSYGIKIQEVAYRSNYLLPILSGEVDFGFIPFTTAIHYSDAKRLRILATTSESKGIKELDGYPRLSQNDNFEELEVTYGLCGSNKMEERFVNYYSKLLNEVLDNQSYRTIQAKNGISIYPPHGPTDYERYISREAVKYRKILAQLNQ